MKKIIKTVSKIILRVADKILLGGAVENFLTEKNILTAKHNENDKLVAGELLNISKIGKLDVTNWISQLLAASVPVLILFALVMGWLDIETIKQFLKLDFSFFENLILSI